MRRSTQRQRLKPLPAVAFLTLIALFTAQAQFGGPPPGPRGPAKNIAPFDLTGYWVSLVTEDWRVPVMTPPKGDFPGVALKPAGRMVAEASAPPQDVMAGVPVKAHVAAAPS